MKIPQMNMKFIKIILKDFEILYKKLTIKIIVIMLKHVMS